MPSPVTASDFEISNFGGDTCEQLRKLLEVNNTLAEFFAWMFNDDGTLTQAFKVLMQDVAVAVGVVVFRPVTSIPAGYLLCNGQAVSRTLYANLFAVFGTTFGSGDNTTTFNLPDFSGFFLMGSGPAGANPVGSQGGAATVTLDTTQIPAHTHGPAEGFSSFLGIVAPAQTSDTEKQGGTEEKGMAATGSTGGGQAHQNLPPYFAGYWLVKY